MTPRIKHECPDCGQDWSTDKAARACIQKHVRHRDELRQRFRVGATCRAPRLHLYGDETGQGNDTHYYEYTTSVVVRLDTKAWRVLVEYTDGERAWQMVGEVR